MRGNPRMRRRAMLSVLAVAGLFALGCLRANVLDFARYDEKTDTYHFLKVYTHVAGSDAELDWIARLWRHRGQVITIPELLPVFSKESALLRVADRETQAIEIGELTTEAPPSQKADLSLAPIEIRPGKFFLSADKTLCCYHQVVVPGKLVDDLCAIGNKDLRRSAVRSVDTELARRRDGGRTISWAQVREAIRKSVDKNKEPAGDAKNSEPAQEESPAGEQDELKPREDEPICAMDEESLQMIRKAAKDGTLGLARKEFQLQLRVPVTPADRREAIATVEMAKKVLLDSIIRGPGMDASEPMKQWETAVTAAVRAEEGPEGALLLILDVGKYVELATRDRRDAKPIESSAADYRRAVEKVRAAGIAIDEKLTLDQVIKSFNAGTLESSPPPADVPPGEGLFPKTKQPDAG